MTCYTLAREAAPDSEQTNCSRGNSGVGDDNRLARCEGYLAVAKYSTPSVLAGAWAASIIEPNVLLISLMTSTDL